MRTMELFWDVGSPYTYFAVRQLPEVLKRTRATVRYRPFLLGGVFKASGNTMPAAVLQKARYLVADLARWRDHLGVEMKMPVTEVKFPLNTLLPMRVAMVAEREGQSEKYCQRIMRAYWAEGHDVSDPAVLREVLASAGFAADEWLTAANEAPAKEALRANTDEAVERGAFGAPSMFVEGELYWGHDRLPFVEAHLARLNVD